MVTCDNFKQSRTQCLVYLLQMISSFGLHTVPWEQMSIDDAAPKSSTCRYLKSLKFQMVHTAVVIHKQLNWNFLYGNLWQLQTVKNSVSCLSAANDKQFWITYCTMGTNVDWWCCSQISLTKQRIFELSAFHEPNSIFWIFLTEGFLA